MTETAARRELAEELGPAASIGPSDSLGEIRQRGGKRVIAFGGEGDFDNASLSSNTFEIEWPPGSGRLRAFPEVDRAEWFDLEATRSCRNKSSLSIGWLRRGPDRQGRSKVVTVPAKRNR
jgi:predicted NUDIX family NTP pyrophosphohydrolase